MRGKGWRILLSAAGAVLLWRMRAVVWQAGVQLFLGMVVALAVLPVARRLEKHVCASTAAGLALGTALAGAAAGVLVLVPPLVRQARELAEMAPSMLTALGGSLERAQGWLVRNGVTAEDGLREMLLQRGQEAIAAAAPAVVNGLGSLAGSLGRWMLAPVFAYYFLRDRKQIGAWLLSLLPLGWRSTAVRMLREMRRETAGYLRGQLLVCAIVGGLTAVGLLFCGVPAWLLLGAVMGVMEFVPYAGPFAAGVLVALFAAPSGLTRTLWALGLVLAVQQLEGSFLSPRLVSDATRLHPVVVLLCVILGGAAGGVTGILLSVPLVLCMRAALRVMCLRSPNSVHSMCKKRFSKT